MIRFHEKCEILKQQLIVRMWHCYHEIVRICSVV